VEAVIGSSTNDRKFSKIRKDQFIARERLRPVALFTKHLAKFMILETVEDEECEIWKERATELKWDSLEFYRSYQKKIPGRDYGQNKYARKVEEIDWSDFDIVISGKLNPPQIDR